MQSTELERTTLRLRQMVLAGEFEPGSRIAEIPLAARLGVSRTPVRLALGILEQEGLLRREAHRGFRVREITAAEILDAFDVRGALESLACEMAVARGIDVATRVVLEECLAEGRALLGKGELVEGDTTKWSEMNARFHQAIVLASRNIPLAKALAVNAQLPLAAPGAIAFTQDLASSFGNMQKVQVEHEEIVEALTKGLGGRAAALAREHAYKSRDKLRERLEQLRRQGDASIPGLRLLVG